MCYVISCAHPPPLEKGKKPIPLEHTSPLPTLSTNPSAHIFPSVFL